ncbi:MAG: NAD(P)/FAD-dependent oxidoreductase [Clostridia bacterium]
MKIEKLNEKIKKQFGDKFSLTETDDSIVVTGQSNDWNEIVKVCLASVDVKSGKHVVNDIKFGGEIPKMRLPKIQDKSLDGQKFDVVVIGGGISGTSILRELSKWKINAILLEKESDIAMQATGRNDGEVHPGVDLGKGSLKQKYVIKGNAMFDKLCADLDVPFKRVGQYAGFTQKQFKLLAKVFAWQRRVFCKVPNTRVVSKEELRKVEPELSDKFEFALYNPTAGCVCPYNLAIAYAENAIDNGARVSLSTAVLDMKVENGKIQSIQTNRGVIYPDVVINCGGVFAEEIARMAGDRFYSIHPRRGTNSILDKKANHLIKSIASIKVFEKSPNHTKGGGMLHTVHDNVLVGPNAVETFEKENFATNAVDIKAVFDKQKNTAPKLSERDIITYFTGVRAPTFEEDFVIEKGHKTKNLIHCAGIQSPGLTTAPAVALDVEKMAIEILREKKNVSQNTNFNPTRHAVPVLRDMSKEERAEMIAKNPDYGIIICRCEEISKGEIIDALNLKLCVPTVDGIKKRLRPGMGRCQGGFCAPLVTKIIADFLGVPLEQVQKGNDGSNLTFGSTKEVR